MRFTRHLSFLSIALLLTLATACNKPSSSGDLAARIPDDATGVMVFNFRKMATGGNLTALAAIPYYKKYIGKLTSSMPEIGLLFKDPAAAGIDTDKNGYGVLLAGADLSISGGNTVVMFPLQSSGKWEGLLKSESVEFEASGKMKSFKGAHNTTITWDDKALFFISGNDDNKENPLAACAKSMADHNILSNAGFQKVLSANQDMSIWINTGALTKNKNKDEVSHIADYAGLPAEIIQDNQISMGFDFNSGAITTVTGLELNKNLHDKLSTYVRGSLSADFSPYFPASGLSSLVTGAIQPEGLLSIPGGGNMLSEFTRGSINLGDLAAICTGDMAMAIYRDNQLPRLSLALQVRDMGTASALMSKLSASGKLRKEGNLYNMSGIYMALVNNTLVVSEKKELVDKAIAGGYAAADRIAAEEWNQVKQATVGFYAPGGGAEMGIQYFGLFFGFDPNAGLSALAEQYFDKARGHLSLDGFSLQIDFKDKQRNGIQQLMEMFDKAEKSMSHENELDKLLKEDSN